ncbi:MULTISPECIES: PD-(D/E)XK nuclease-like domain-containing protein [unclassified Microbacterium]|uniref:PD-(D/E)XK nuclease-like domain-containing protein n=1 Tax=unclassified Microbacterium TaxID=2609290 RepID=UPI000EA9F475|nr:MULTISPECIES: PD-(D/E)XK nuclease-like domain-containing protein [unclassified Microbacterium]MBT2485785.1 PD-(D/E)XK nuclease-like domain-containing protein [Microbacterium sp. ISL-108]RKN68546.1 hypothetical protein D7252_13790 [Microbacterium sp. CGR2]
MSDYQGLVHGLEEQRYHRQPGLSSTGAKKILKSPAHYHHYVTHPEEPRDAFDLGSAVHAKVLGVGADIAVYPDGNGPERFEYDGAELDNVLASNGAISTKAAKAFEADARSKGLIPVKRVTARVVNLMAESVLSNGTARALFEGGQPEVSMFATDPATGVPMRGRLDYLSKRIADLKTTAGDASESGFARQAFTLGYEIQFGWYSHIYELITGERPPWLFVVVEASAPYLANVHVFSEDGQRIGSRKAQAARELYARCLESGLWPGYPNRSGGAIGILDVPMYAIYEYQERFSDDGLELVQPRTYS